MSDRSWGRQGLHSNASQHDKGVPRRDVSNPTLRALILAMMESIRPSQGCSSLSWPPSAAATHAIKAPITIESAVKMDAAELALRAASAA
jgi:hypothetical protein